MDLATRKNYTAPQQKRKPILDKTYRKTAVIRAGVVVEQLLIGAVFI